MKILHIKLVFRAVFATYLLMLLWLVLFKFSYDIFAVLSDFQTRSLSLIPFADSRENMREMVDNLIVFVPFGLLLNANFKQISLWQKLAYIFFFSFAVEAFQFIFAIGITDITDVIMNTYGGFLGLALYDLANKYVDSKKLDRWITIVCAISLVVFLLLRVFVFKVKY